jgi:hypothetical protein
MGKVALGVAGRADRSLKRVAGLWLTPWENTCQNRTSQTGHLDLSPSFYNKIGTRTEHHLASASRRFRGELQGDGGPTRSRWINYAGSLKDEAPIHPRNRALGLVLLLICNSIFIQNLLPTSYSYTPPQIVQQAHFGTKLANDVVLVMSSPGHPEPGQLFVRTHSPTGMKSVSPLASIPSTTWLSLKTGQPELAAYTSRPTTKILEMSLFRTVPPAETFSGKPLGWPRA